MSAATPLPDDAPLDRLDADLPEIPEAWTAQDPSDAPFRPRAAWQHDETGQWVTVERDKQPTQMHTPETSRDDTGFHASVYHADGTGGRNLSYELGSKDAAYEAAIQFVAKYPAGDFEIPPLTTWDDKKVVW